MSMSLILSEFSFSLLTLSSSLAAAAERGPKMSP